MKLKVISLNIWSGLYLDQAINFINTEDPDILLLQEVYGGNGDVRQKRFRTYEALKEELKLPYSHFAPALRLVLDEGKFVMGNAIFSKLPIKEPKAVFFNDPYHDNFIEDIKNNMNFPHVLQSAVIDTPAGEVNVFNLHGTWDLDGDNYSEKRQQMAKAIIEGTDGKLKVILAGDTNAKPTNKAIKDLEKHLKSVFGHELTTTFNMKHKDNPGYATAAVDMMFVSSDIKVIEKDCPSVDVSDHLPLVATLEI